MVEGLPKTPYLTRYKDSSNWYFQRAVPSDCQKRVGKKKWVVSLGSDLATARRGALTLLQQTDETIQRVRGQHDPQRHQKALEANLTTVRGRSAEELSTDEEFHILRSSTPSMSEDKVEESIALPPIELRSYEDLIDLYTKIRKPRPNTLDKVENQCLRPFMELAKIAYPVLGTVQHAQEFLDSQLKKVSNRTAKDRIAHLKALWKLMKKRKWVTENIFEGLTDELVLEKTVKTEIIISIPDEKHVLLLPHHQVLYQIIRWTGCRLAEGAGLRVEDVDLKKGTLKFVDYPERELKNVYSHREIPIHKNLIERLTEYVEGKEGALFPTLYNPKSGIWGNGLKWSKTITYSAHKIRDYVTQDLREREVNERVIGSILGHTPNNVTGTYGTVTLEAKRKAINLLK